MLNKHTLVISRDWNNPQIAVHVTDERIEVKMPLKDFMEALVQEAGSPTMIMTQAALKRRLDLAARSVCEKAKQVTSQVMN